MEQQGPGETLFRTRDWKSARGTTLELAVRRLDELACALLKPQLRDALQRGVDRGMRAFVVDLARAEIVDACGIGMLTGLRNQAAGAGACLWLVGISDNLRRIFRMMHLEEHFDIAADVRDVERRLAAPVA